MMKKILNEWRKFLIEVDAPPPAPAPAAPAAQTPAAQPAAKKSPRFRQDVQDLQKALNKALAVKKLGKLPPSKYDPNGEDGEYGPQTRRYVLKFIPEKQLRPMKIADIAKKLEELIATNKLTVIGKAEEESIKQFDRGIGQKGEKDDTALPLSGERLAVEKPLDLGLTIDKPFESAVQYATYLSDLYKNGTVKSVANKTFFIKEGNKIYSRTIVPNPEQVDLLKIHGGQKPKLVKTFKVASGEVPAGQPGSKNEPFDDMKQAEDMLKNYKQNFPDVYKPGFRYYYKAYKGVAGKGLQTILYANIPP